MRKSLLAFTLVGVTAAASVAQAPDSLSFQGRLTDPTGIPIDTPSVSMTFKLYRGGTAVWEETHPSVAVVDGGFNVLLGGISRLDTMAFDRPFDIGIAVGSDPEMSPRTPLGAVAYAKALPGLYTRRVTTTGWKSFNVVGGASNNFVDTGVTGATISGGGGSSSVEEFPNSVSNDFSTVGGGRGNTASGAVSTIGGGMRNLASNYVATVSGGLSNTASGSRSTISGGSSNLASGAETTISGGRDNSATSSGATIGGGEANVASGSGATIGGGFENSAAGISGTVPGGSKNSAKGWLSFAAGWAAKANHNGTFVWNDRSIAGGNDSLLSTGPNQFLIRAVGGVGIGTNAPSNQLTVAGDVDVTGKLGIGTNAPGAKIHVSGVNGSTSGLRLEATQGDQLNVYYVADVGVLIDSYRPGDARRLPLLLQSAGGNVGIGTSAPSSLLHVDAGESPDLVKLESSSIIGSFLEFENTSPAGRVFKTGILANTGTGNSFYTILDQSLGQHRLVVLHNGNVGIGTTTPTEKLEVIGNVKANNVSVTSDVRLKKNIETIDEALDAVKRLRGVAFDWRVEEYPNGGLETGRQLGFIAQDMVDVLPDVVRKGEDGFYEMRYSQIIPVLVEAIKEQQAEIERMQIALEMLGSK